jgi:hypothetical protein
VLFQPALMGEPRNKSSETTKPPPPDQVQREAAQ